MFLMKHFHKGYKITVSQCPLVIPRLMWIYKIGNVDIKKEVDIEFVIR